MSETNFRKGQGLFGGMFKIVWKSLSIQHTANQFIPRTRARPAMVFLMFLSLGRNKFLTSFHQDHANRRFTNLFLRALARLTMRIKALRFPSFSIISQRSSGTPRHLLISQDALPLPHCSHRRWSGSRCCSSKKTWSWEPTSWVEVQD